VNGPTRCRRRAGLDSRARAEHRGYATRATRKRRLSLCARRRLPEYLRVLGQEARHLHDHGRHLHPAPARSAPSIPGMRTRSTTADRSMSRKRPISSGLPMFRVTFRLPSTISADGAPSISTDGGAIRNPLPVEPRSRSSRPDVPRRRRADFVRRPSPTSSQTTISKPLPSRYPQCPAGGRALFPLDPAAAAVNEIDQHHFTKSVMHGRSSARSARVLPVMDDLRSADASSRPRAIYPAATRNHHGDTPYALHPRRIIRLL